MELPVTHNDSPVLTEKVHTNISHAVHLDNILSGAVDEAFQHELIKVLQNIVDPNTQATAKRKLTIEFTFGPSGQRDYATTKIMVKSTAGGNHNEPLETSLMITGSGQHVTAVERLTEQSTLFGN